SLISVNSTPNKAKRGYIPGSSWVRPTRVPCWIPFRRRSVDILRVTGPFLSETARGMAMRSEKRSHCRCASSVGRYDAPVLGPQDISLRYIPKGYAGTRKTTEAMQRLIHQGAKDFYVRQKAIDILLERTVKPKDYLGEITALFWWVQNNIRYTKDPFRLEVLH